MAEDKKEKAAKKPAAKKTVKLRLKRLQQKNQLPKLRRKKL